MPRASFLCLLISLALAGALGCKAEDSPKEAPADTKVVVAPPPAGEVPAPADVAAPPKDAEQSESGLACIVLRKGTGRLHPAIYDIVKMHQVVWTTDGKMHMNTGNRGDAVQFELTQSVLPGLREAIELMVEGEKRRCWIPGWLAFGEANPGAVDDGKPRGMLVYDLDLVNLRKAVGLPKAPPDVASVPNDATKNESGLAWRVLKEPTGDKAVAPNSLVSLFYTGWTPEGQVFMTTARRNVPNSVQLTGVIPGWREALMSMKIGEKRRLWIPPELAYRNQPGRPKGMVVFDLEVVAIRP